MSCGGELPLPTSLWSAASSAVFADTTPTVREHAGYTIIQIQVAGAWIRARRSEWWWCVMVGGSGSWRSVGEEVVGLVGART